MTQTPTLNVTVPPELADAARAALPNGATLTRTELVRAALAHVAGVDVRDYTPVRTGRPRGAKTRRGGPPVAMTCQACGHTWQTRAPGGATLQCPGPVGASRCRRTIRVPISQEVNAA